MLKELFALFTKAKPKPSILVGSQLHYWGESVATPTGLMANRYLSSMRQRTCAAWSILNGGYDRFKYKDVAELVQYNTENSVDMDRHEMKFFGQTITGGDYQKRREFWECVAFFMYSKMELASMTTICHEIMKGSKETTLEYVNRVYYIDRVMEARALDAIAKGTPDTYLARCIYKDSYPAQSAYMSECISPDIDLKYHTFNIEVYKPLAYWATLSRETTK